MRIHHNTAPGGGEPGPWTGQAERRQTEVDTQRARPLARRQAGTAGVTALLAMLASAVLAVAGNQDLLGWAVLALVVAGLGTAAATYPLLLVGARDAAARARADRDERRGFR